MNEQNTPLGTSTDYDPDYTYRRSRRISRNRVTMRFAGLFTIFAFAFYTWLALNRAAFMVTPNFDPSEPIFQTDRAPDAPPSAMLQIDPRWQVPGEVDTVYHAIENESNHGEFSNVPGQTPHHDWIRLERDSSGRIFPNRITIQQSSAGDQVNQSNTHDDPEPVPSSDSNNDR